MKTEDEILKKVCKQSYLFKNEGHFGTVDIEKAVSLTRKECGLEQTEKIMIAFEKGKQAERKECEIEKHKYAILCMRGREKEIEQAERKKCEWKQQANYNAGFKEGQQKDFEKEVVSYYKGKKVTDADALLLRTAKNNFKEGQQAEQIRIFDVLQQYKNEDSSFILIKIKEALKTRLGQKEE